MRQALAAQHRLHHSIFDCSINSWQTRQHGSCPRGTAADASFKFVAGLRERRHDLAVWPLRPPGQQQQQQQQQQQRRQPPTWSMPLPPGFQRRLRPPAWSPDASHVAVLAAVQASQGTEIQLMLLRNSDGASTIQVLDSVADDVSTPELRLEWTLQWAPCSPAGSPRLAVAKTMLLQASSHGTSAGACGSQQ